MIREVTWDGIHNARDLGGLPTSTGSTRFGRIFRMPRPDALSATGWAQLETEGVRTLVDLRNTDEIAALPMRPGSVRSVHRAIEDQSDAEFMELMGPYLGSPVYYPENLRRWPGRIAAAVQAVADAGDGGVVIHCSAGRDRTGLITAMILSLCDVTVDAILDDYELGVRETNDHLLAHPHPREDARTPTELDSAIASARFTLAALLGDLDVERYLLDAGCSTEHLHNVRLRLL